MCDSAAAIALRNAKATLQFASRTIKPIEEGELSISQRQGEELVRFIRAFSTNLQQQIENAAQDEGDYTMQILLGRQQELEEALQFIDQAFIGPRFQTREQQFLEAADWLCVDGFRCYVDDEKGPIGPLVAIDARRSPAVWEPGASLPLPSLFQRQPQQISRSQEADDQSRSLAYFPVVCLPSSLARLPELYPLLSHEVGHAVDQAHGLTGLVVEQLPDELGNHKSYWQAWMREIIADTIALQLSGKAFAHALYNFARYLRVPDTISDTCLYPSISLRYALLLDQIAALGADRFALGDFRPEQLDKVASTFRVQFRSAVWPILRQVCCKSAAGIDWQQEDHTCEDLASKLLASLAGKKGKRSFPWPEGVSFRLAPSVVALAQLKAEPSQQQSLDTLAMFRKLHNEVPAASRPKWILEPSHWNFPERVLSALRPTIVGMDGCSKVPPEDLLLRHQRIAFVGATHGQLAPKLADAFGAGTRWKRLDIFFASPELLDQVVREPAEDLNEESLSAKEALLALLLKGIAAEWTIYQFDGPAIFGAYWDSDEPGGRIHISPQLLGTDIRRCPAMDYTWSEDVPSIHYEAYRRHLNELKRRAHVVAST